ncbi:hypothetical protein SAMN04487926_10214 [Paraburkholderia steynii]|uniref:Uncharacterized protein n=2 Tax=Paraburkholderia TaxID=1822464 RepID=A0A7Z7B0Z3_9BURK|nr:hypothetical protein SAMN04487926_10214 [Paraburkholderia steynii]
MKIENCVTGVLDGSAYVIRQASVVIHIQQDCARVAQQPIRPVRITRAPTIPAAGSIQTQPNRHASRRPTITSNPNTATGIASLK